MKKLVYMAHPLGGSEDRNRNICNAREWRDWFNSIPGICALAPWIEMAEICDEDMRDQGLALDKAVVNICAEVWLCGGRISPGMQLEATWAYEAGKPVWNWIRMGRSCPRPGNLMPGVEVPWTPTTLTTTTPDVKR